MQPFRFAVQSSRAPTVEDWRALARRCEALGYSCLYIPDHFGDQFGPLVALTVAAEATTTLRVGSLVFDNDYRHPVVLAKEIATLALASGGRVEFGLGAGWMTTDYDESGIALDPPRARVERMREGLAVMRALWSQERVRFSGAYYTVTEAKGLPRPASVPPIVIGGGGRRILSIAAEEADIVGINVDLRSGAVDVAALAGIVPAKWDERVAWVRAAAGARLDALELQVLTFFVRVGTPQREVLEEVSKMFGLAPEVLADIPLAIAGTVDEICAQLVERRERWGFNYIVVHDGDVDAFAPVVARLRGT
ncbi:MAG TPA: TIGR03621 family F420-dependent LLM class oxidoreductase [Acidimicrobiales bacterium]|nr:TIGR03621 family F420-dependent LLM class oxidoreductase [Acidimicrobiales bacterium]